MRCQRSIYALNKLLTVSQIEAVLNQALGTGLAAAGACRASVSRISLKSKLQTIIGLYGLHSAGA